MRAVIWTVIALLVVAAVIFFVVAKPGRMPTRPAPTAADFKRDAAHFAKRANEFIGAAGRLGSELTGRGRLNDELKAKLADLQAKAAQLQGKAKQLETGTGKAAEQVKQELVKLARDCEDLVRALEKARK